MEKHEKTSETLRKSMLVLLGFSLFVVLAVTGTHDSALLGIGTERVRVPFANVEVPFLTFLFVGPGVLISLQVYVHVFLGELRYIDQTLPKMKNDERLPTLFNLKTWFPVLLTELIFYWLVPAVLLVTTWKASASPPLGQIMVALSTIIIIVFQWICIRRCYSRYRILLNFPRWALVLSGIIVLSFIVTQQIVSIPKLSYVEFRRPLNLEGIDLDGVSIGKANMRNAILNFASLEGADLSGANLSGAKMNNTNLKSSFLRSANMTETSLYETILEDAKLGDAILERAEIRGANLKNAHLPSANLDGAHLVASNLEGANLINAKLNNAELVWVNLKNANLAKAELWGAKVKRTDVRNASLQEAELVDVDTSELLNLDTANTYRACYTFEECKALYYD